MSTAELSAMRNRLFTKGASAFSDAELLSLVMCSPNIARKLTYIKPKWHDLNLAELLRMSQVGKARAAQFVALVELASRISSIPLSRGDAIKCSDQVSAAYGTRLARQRQEHFLALSLNTKHRVIAEHEIAKGTLDSVIVHPREVFRKLISDSAAATIVIHNHPSGDPEPSAEDRTMCSRLCRAGELLGITVLDFIIIGMGSSYSFADNGDMP